MGLDKSRKGGIGILGVLRKLGTRRSTIITEKALLETCSPNQEQFNDGCSSPTSLSSISSTSESSFQWSSESLSEHGYAIQAKLDAITAKLKRLDEAEFGSLLADVTSETVIYRQYIWPSHYEHILEKLLLIGAGTPLNEGTTGRRKLSSLAICDFVDLARGLLMEMENRKAQEPESRKSTSSERRSCGAIITGEKTSPLVEEPSSILDSSSRPKLKWRSEPPGNLKIWHTKNKGVGEWVPFCKDSPYCLDGKITEKSKHVVACGGYSDVWTGKLDNKVVAVKALRGFSGGGYSVVRSKLTKRIWREYLAWSSLSHPNILQCLGFSFDFSLEWQSDIPALISPWMSSGTVLSYIRNNPEADRMPLIVGITQGLLYLHTRCPSVVHGDIRAGNILISDEGIPRFTDFGLSRIMHDGIGLTTSSEAAGSLRWMAPELFNDVKVNVESDVWAYGMTLLEIATCKRPYGGISADIAVLRLIVEAQLPPRPNLNEAPLLVDDLWEICRECWTYMPQKRPTMQEIGSKLITEERYQEWKHLSIAGSNSKYRAKRVASEPMHISSRKVPERSPIVWRRSTRTRSSSLWEF